MGHHRSRPVLYLCALALGLLAPVARADDQEILLLLDSVDSDIFTIETSLQRSYHRAPAESVRAYQAIGEVKTMLATIRGQIKQREEKSVILENIQEMLTKLEASRPVVMQALTKK